MNQVSVGSRAAMWERESKRESERESYVGRCTYIADSTATSTTVQKHNFTWFVRHTSTTTTTAVPPNRRTDRKLLQEKEVHRSVQECKGQCDQILRNFATLEKNYKSFGKFLKVYLVFGKNCEHNLSNFLYYWSKVHCCKGSNIK